jgi:hypothetical protein
VGDSSHAPSRSHAVFINQVLFLESLRLHKQLQGDGDHADIAHGLSTLALLHQDTGQLDRALELAQVSLR